MLKQKSKASTRKSQGKSTSWGPLIQIAEQRLARIQLKTSQLEALLATMRQQAKAGEPSPADIAMLGTDANQILQ
jgi:hypothetical protein